MINNYIEKIKASYIKNPLLLKTLFAFSLFAAFLINAPILNIILDFIPEIKDFSNHVISNATLYNFDVSSRVKIYYLIFTSIIVFSILIFFISYKITVNKFNKSANSQKVLEKVLQISYIGIAALLANLLVFKIDLAILFLLFLSSFYLYSSYKKTNVLINNGLWILITAIPFTFLFHRILLTSNLLSSFPKEILKKESISSEELLFFLLFGLITVVINLFLKIFIKSDSTDLTQKHKKFYLATLPISYILIALTIMFEVFNIINLRTGFVFGKPLLLFIIITLLAIITSIIFYISITKKQKNITYNPIKKYHIPLLIIGLALIYSQPWRFMYPEQEFFEMANHGISVDHFFRYGSIPILETFDAHMLSNQLFAYVYGFLNGYEPWAPFLYISYISVFIFVLVYYLIKKLTGSFQAFILVLAFPMLGAFNTSYIFAGVVALTLLNLYNNKSKSSFYLFWSSIIFICLYRLDLGYSAALGALIGYFIIHFITKKEYRLKSLIITGAISASIVGGIFIILCLIKGINPVNRLIEFLIVSMSNQNWAFASVGDSSLVVFRITYYILPLITLFLLLKLILKSIFVSNFLDHISNNRHSLAALIFFIFFALFFYFNIPRGIVRHSLISNIMSTTLSTIPIALMCYTYIFQRKNNLVYFLALLISTYFLINLTSTSLKGADSSLFSKSINSASFNEEFQTAVAFENTRVKESFNFGEINNFKQILDTLLKEDETYFDFSSMNYYYALTGRKNPVYVNQSPLLLNGDKSQEITLEEIKKTNPSLVLMPTADNIWHKIDEIPVEYKYYKIAEYIYKNYTPLLTLSQFTIYVNKSKKVAFEQKLKIDETNNFTIKNFSQLDINQIQKQDILVERDQNNFLKITSNGADPFLFGIYKAKPSDKSSPKTIKLKFETPTTGFVQVFYLLKGDENFKEENSKKIEILKPGTYDFEIDVPTAIQDIRIDVDTQSIILKELSVVNKEINLLTNTTPISYNFGEIPMVWGNKADQHLFNSIKNMNESLNQNAILMPISIKNNDKNKPYFLLVEMESDTIQAARVELLTSQNNKAVEYLFRVNPGKNKYTIRLSANLNWWNQAISNISMNTERNVKITKFAIIAEDGKTQLIYNDNDVTLSNITDINWTGGISNTNPNLILFDNTPRMLKLLKKSKAIKLNNNVNISIMKYTISGNYIHVEVKESILPYKSIILYPNNFKLN